ncbi:MAG: hypothetical protein ACKVS6_03995 [Planctomycetota bacterium]
MGPKFMIALSLFSFAIYSSALALPQGKDAAVGVHPATAAGRACDSYLARHIPDALIFFRCPSIGALGKHAEGLSLAKMFQDEELKHLFPNDQQSVDEIYQSILMGLRSEVPDFPQEIVEQIDKLFQTGLTGELALAMSPPVRTEFVLGNTTISSNEPDVYATLGLPSDPGAAANFDKLLALVAEYVTKKDSDVRSNRISEDGNVYFEFKPADNRGDERNHGIRIGRKGGNILFSAPTHDSILRLMNPAPDHSFANSSDLIEADHLFSQRPGSMYVFVNGPAFLNTIKADRTELAPLGLDELRWAGLSFEPDGEYVRHRLEIRSNATRGIPTLFTEKQQFDLATVLPAKTVFSCQLAMDGAATGLALRRLMIRYAGKGEMNWNTRMKRMREATGTDVDELLNLTGNELSVAVVAPENGIIPDLYLLVRSKNAEAASRLALLLESACRRPESGLKVYTTQFKSKQLIYTEMPGEPLSPAMVVDGEMVVIGSSVMSAKKWLQFRMDSQPSLASLETYQESVAAMGNAPSTAQIWVDWEAITRFVYGNFTQIAPLLFARVDESMDELEPPPEPGVVGGPVKDTNESQARRLQENAQDPKNPKSNKNNNNKPALNWGFDPSMFPPVEVVASYIKPQFIRVRVNGLGLSMESRASF